MSISSFEELIALANDKETDIEKLRVLQQYFLENVEYNFIYDIAQNLIMNESQSYKDFKTRFNSDAEKIEEIAKFERKYGENFHFSIFEKYQLFGALGDVVEPSNETPNMKRDCSFSITIKSPINKKGFDGSIVDSIKRIANTDEVYKNDLIVRGLCKDFVVFVKRFCDCFNIACKVFTCENGAHVFNVINVGGEERVFDFTRMIGIRDGYLNQNNPQIDDWFNMSFEKMFEYKPNRQIVRIDDVPLEEPITRDNFNKYDETENQSIKKPI